MQTLKHREKDLFIDVMEKIQSLTSSQQKFLKEMLFRPEKKITKSKKALLRKSFGLWAERTDVLDSIEYINNMRAGWDTRLNKTKG